ncbi:hypothetical protein BOTCAL_0083g00300 [Botryotinia calthae]|uniref:Uncharacterized protein n=1 Tax=Botryotinia calthae TaxID=38488 RepID=A0A4Y8DA93_9HELO|nr:hypothetical protein BOTCAL_0083g00300 [Botryotinia calthae]
MVSIKVLLLWPSIVLALTTVTQVKNDITTLDINVQALTSQTALYNGGLLPAAPLLGSLTAVYLSLLQGVTDSALLPPSISESDAQSLNEHVNVTLAIDNPIAINTLKGKKALFKEQGLDGAIVAGLGLLLAGHEAFTNNVLQRLPEDQSADGQEVTQVITVALTDGIHYFESP